MGRITDNKKQEKRINITSVTPGDTFKRLTSSSKVYLRQDFSHGRDNRIFFVEIYTGVVYDVNMETTEKVIPATVKVTVTED